MLEFIGIKKSQETKSFTHLGLQAWHIARFSRPSKTGLEPFSSQD